MVQIYYAYTDILPDIDPDVIMGQMPQRMKSKLSQLKRDEDKSLLLTSIVLLSKALYDNGCDYFKLNEIQYSDAGRPFFPDSVFDFNISHTANCAAVVFSKDCRVGIDVEKIAEIDFSDFTDYFTDEQWEDIKSAKDKFKRFYYYWTLIESAVKADGRGLSIISTHNIKLAGRDLFIDNVQWYYNHQEFDQLISCCITTDRIVKWHKIKQVTAV